MSRRTSINKTEELEVTLISAGALSWIFAEYVESLPRGRTLARLLATVRVRCRVHFSNLSSTLVRPMSPRHPLCA